MTKKFVFKDRVLHNYAPVNIVHNTLFKRKVPQKLEEILPCKKKEGKYLKYTHYDALAALLTFFLVGYKRLSQMDYLSQSAFESPFYKSEISYHTIKEKILSMVEAPDLERKMVNGKYKYFSIYRNPILNSTILALVDHLGLLPKGIPLTIDIDTTLLDTKGKHSSTSYLKRHGYNPLLITVNRIPIYYECRTGNINPKTMLFKAVEHITRELRNLGYTVATVRIDAAGYSMTNANTFENLELKFALRARTAKDDYKKLRPTNATLNNRTIMIAERHKQFGKVFSRYIYNNDNPSRRLVAIVTNDFKTPAADVIKTYQDRGTSEQVIRDLKDFGWETMMFHDIKPNAVYMGFCIIAFVLFKFITSEYSRILKEVDPDFLKEHTTLKVFRNKFLSCDGRWHGDVLEIFDNHRRHIYEQIIEN